jgi:phenylpropionate dioxygenase-like ring-hydroxylating dioxygenase large terminal subunit
MFLAHVNDIVPNLKKPLAQFQLKKTLINNGQFKLVNNICPHQKSLIISKSQDTLQCRYHAWSWNDKGEPISNGTTSVCNNFQLVMKETYTSNNLIFSEQVDLSSLPLDFSHMKLVEERTDTINANHNNIIDIFLDVDHISVVHPDVYTKVGIAEKTEVHWEYYDWGSIQLVQKNNLYDKDFESTLLGSEEDLSAVWITVYPYTTIDWQPGCLTIVVCVPVNETSTNAVIYKYRDIRYNDENWKINSDIWETAWRQDSEQAECITSQAIVDNHLDPGKRHFKNWKKANGTI